MFNMSLEIIIFDAFFSQNDYQFKLLHNLGTQLTPSVSIDTFKLSLELPQTKIISELDGVF